MVFWCMMMLFTLMIPAVMIGFGRSFFKKPPRDINATFGYRTTMSMKNQETWQLAHRGCGRYWFICGLILLPLSVLPMLFVINRGTETIGMTGGIIVFVQIVPMLCVIIPTEHAQRMHCSRILPAKPETAPYYGASASESIHCPSSRSSRSSSSSSSASWRLPQRS